MSIEYFLGLNNNNKIFKKSIYEKNQHTLSLLFLFQTFKNIFLRYKCVENTYEEDIICY